ncbi:MAG: EamA family transporter [Opitutaceae bacterium]
MTTLALALVLIAAGLHATWNLCSKKSGGGLPFVNLVGWVNLALYVPFVAGYWLWRHPSLPGFALVWIAGSGVLKAGYALFLQRSYRVGDFSLVYPLARGTGPLLASAAAIAFMGERPGLLAVAGGLLIIGSIFFLADGLSIFRVRDGAQSRGVRYGLISGVFIAAYTLWDRHGVANLSIPPLLYDCGTTVTGVILLTPSAARRMPEVKRHWREHRLYVFAVAGLSSISYILVLTALSFTPVSYVAPAREISIVIGAFIGAKYLREAGARRRFWAAGAIVIGIVALAVG